ncbi:hypothetical protein V1525DRAFT_422415 [Lipomyces kononenkoae]|uniref:Uncharacterized protein n=1 Tax=Lipomyces kononenkoae TaxID=34357 RepID=A0ACC3SRJ9_LIPKO
MIVLVSYTWSQVILVLAHLMLMWLLLRITDILVLLTQHELYVLTRCCGGVGGIIATIRDLSRKSALRRRQGTIQPSGSNKYKFGYALNQTAKAVITVTTLILSYYISTRIEIVQVAEQIASSTPSTNSSTAINGLTYMISTARFDFKGEATNTPNIVVESEGFRVTIPVSSVINERLQVDWAGGITGLSNGVNYTQTSNIYISSYNTSSATMYGDAEMGGWNATGLFTNCTLWGCYNNLTYSPTRDYVSTTGGQISSIPPDGETTITALFKIDDTVVLNAITISREDIYDSVYMTSYSPMEQDFINLTAFNRYAGYSIKQGPSIWVGHRQLFADAANTMIADINGTMVSALSESSSPQYAELGYPSQTLMYNIGKMSGETYEQKAIKVSMTYITDMEVGGYEIDVWEYSTEYSVSSAAYSLGDRKLLVPGLNILTDTNWPNGEYPTDVPSIYSYWADTYVMIPYTLEPLLTQIYDIRRLQGSVYNQITEMVRDGVINGDGLVYTSTEYVTYYDVHIPLLLVIVTAPLVVLGLLWEAWMTRNLVTPRDLLGNMLLEEDERFFDVESCLERLRDRLGRGHGAESYKHRIPEQPTAEESKFCTTLDRSTCDGRDSVPEEKRLALAEPEYEEKV